MSANLKKVPRKQPPFDKGELRKAWGHRVVQANYWQEKLDGYAAALQAIRKRGTASMADELLLEALRSVIDDGIKALEDDGYEMEDFQPIFAKNPGDARPNEQEKTSK